MRLVFTFGIIGMGANYAALFKNDDPIFAGYSAGIGGAAYEDARVLALNAVRAQRNAIERQVKCRQ